MVTPHKSKEIYRPYFTRNMPESLRYRLHAHAQLRGMSMEHIVNMALERGLDSLDRETDKIRKAIEDRSEVLNKMFRHHFGVTVEEFKDAKNQESDGPGRSQGLRFEKSLEEIESDDGSHGDGTETQD